MAEQDVSKIAERLAEPFSANDIEWRVGRKSKDGKKASVLAYVTNRAIMKRLDEVMGIDCWRNEFQEWRGKGVLCGLSLRINGEWLTKFDAAEETNIEATKGGISDSMKRAAVQWGIGRYLYYLDDAWVQLGEYDKFTPPKLPDWALPESERGNGAKPQRSADIPKPAPAKQDKHAEAPASQDGAPHPNKNPDTTKACQAIYVEAKKKGLTNEQVREIAAKLTGKEIATLYDLGTSAETYREVYRAVAALKKEG